MRPENRTDAQIHSDRAGDSFQVGTLHALMEMQRDLFSAFEQVHRDRLDRTRQETELVSEFAQKLARARAIPEIMTICQEWIARRVELFGEDSQKVTNTALRALSKGTVGTEK